MVVQHNLTAMNSNRMLGLTKSTQARSTEKLSSGYKINRAADDAAGLSISEKMRKQIRGLTQASTNAQDGISAVQTAEGALNEVQDMLQRMNELAVKAANGTNSEDDRSYIQDEIDQLVTEIDRVAETTKFNETYLLKGDTSGVRADNFSYKPASTVKQDVWYLDKNGETQKAKAGSFYDGLDSTYTYYTSDKGKVVGKAADSTNVESTYVVKSDMENKLYMLDGGEYKLLKAGDTVATNQTLYTGTYDSGVALQTMQSVGSADFAESAYVTKGTVYDSTGASVAEGTLLGSDSAVISTYANETAGAKLMGETIAYADLAGSSSTVQLQDKDGNEIAQNGLDKYLEVKDGAIKIKADAAGKLFKSDGTPATEDDISKLVTNGKQPTGALSLKLHVGADATDNNQIQIDLESMSAKSIGVDNLKVDGKDDTAARNAIETIKEALQKVSTQRSALGAVQNRLEHTIANLDNVVENTTSAESTIRDTDMATEMVKYSNNNILAQAGQAMLAQANQSNQGVLSLLG